MEGEKNPEGLRLTTETILGNELIDTIHIDGEYDPRFFPLAQGGVFHYSPLSPSSEANKPGVYYSLLRLNDLIVGLGELQFSPIPGEEDVLWFKAISIDENLKGKGYSDRLLREMFQFAKSKNAKLWISKPTKEGKERTRYKLRKLAEEFGVQIFGGKGESFAE